MVIHFDKKSGQKAEKCNKNAKQSCIIKTGLFNFARERGAKAAPENGIIENKIAVCAKSGVRHTHA